MKKILLSSLFFLVFITSCAPTSTPALSPVPDSSPSPAVLTVDMFYTFINVAQAPDELGTPWNILTSEAQCNPVDKCELTNFQTKWWKSKALYRLYSCDPNTVLVEEMLYPRDADSPSTMNNPNYWAYELVGNNGLMLISKIRAAHAPTDDCVLTIERIANP